MPSDLRDKPLVACLHPYVEERRKEIEQGLYPRNHLWGLEKIEKEKSWRSTTISSSSVRIPSLLESLLNQSFFRGSPGAKAEIAAFRAARTADLVYSVCGPLALVRRFRQAKLVSWVFREPPHVEKGPRLAHAAYRPERLSCHAGFLCLTPKAEETFRKYAPSRFLPWCVDLELFDGKPAEASPERPFFLATGKTERDYETLTQAANKVNADVRIIGPASLRPANLPPNLRWINTSSDPPDQAIDYPTLREWYAQCIGVCIPLTGDADDTCGYTNLLEGMAMAKPVLMTKSGCLGLDPESEGCGLWIRPKDIEDWRGKMNLLIEKPNLASEMGDQGRKIAERDFSPARFDADVVDFLKKLMQ
ncbi:MAG: glycosyltransferase [Verrucomicrobia bacterium]|nr:glycosyltransferase [Verrucomicrobiota bacterium]MDA1047343.1 glycosyltransferase [Verrucomicrobiota bacterium]